LLDELGKEVGRCCVALQQNDKITILISKIEKRIG
jgi:hypothetical protein